MRLAAAALALALPAAAFAETGWTPGAEASVMYDSNLGNAPLDQPAVESAGARLAAQLTRCIGLGEGVALQLRAGLAEEAFVHAGALDQIAPGLQARVFVHPGRGFFTPTLMAGVNAEWQEFNSRMRDGAEYRAHLALLQPLNTSLQLRVSASRLHRQSRSAVFDLDSAGGALDLEWHPLPRHWLHAGYQRWRGDVAASSLPNPRIFAAAEQIAPDDALEDRIPGLRAYRFNADSDIASAGWTLALNPKLSLDMQLRQAAVCSTADGGIRYRRAQIEFGLLQRFGH